MSPERIQEFIRTLSAAEVRALLTADPLGAAFLERSPDADDGDLRWELFDLFDARPRFFLRAVEDKAAAERQARAQLWLPLREVAA